MGNWYDAPEAREFMLKVHDLIKPMLADYGFHYTKITAAEIRYVYESRYIIVTLEIEKYPNHDWLVRFGYDFDNSYSDDYYVDRMISPKSFEEESSKSLDAINKAQTMLESTLSELEDPRGYLMNQ